MKEHNLDLKVGMFTPEDRIKRTIRGRHAGPDNGSDTLIIMATGIMARHEEFFECFGNYLGEEANIYIFSQRNKGIARGGKLIEDFLQIEQQIREMFGGEKVIYMGHSMGAAVANRAYERGICETVDGFYGISAYPVYGSVFARNGNFHLGISEQGKVGNYEYSILESAVNMVSYTDLSALIRISTKKKFSMPARIALGGIDEWLHLDRPEVQRRFISYFHEHGADTKIFEGKNHNFNNTQGVYAPFNKDESYLLVDNILEFVRDISKKEHSKPK